jgi:uncharacterized protein
MEFHVALKINYLNMKIIIAAGTGFLGNELYHFFTKKGHEVLVLTRKPSKNHHIQWDAATIENWAKHLENSDVLINMTGKSVDCRYNQTNRSQILSSRIQSTRVLQQAVDKCTSPPKIWLNASSATIYIHAETTLMTEPSGTIGDDFSMNICKAWEKEFFANPNPNIRKVALRTSIVLGKNGGAFPKLKQITKLGLGGRQGQGTQYMSWIHIVDFCNAVSFIIENEQLHGPINVTAPSPLSNQKFMQTIRKILRIPFGLPSPRFLLELAAIFINTETELLLKSRYVYPHILLKNGFQFQYCTAAEAIEQLIAPSPKATPN